MFQRRRSYLRWLWLSRFRSSGGGSSRGSDAVIREGTIGDAGVVGDSARAKTSVGTV